MRESDLPNKKSPWTVRRLMKVGGFFVLLVCDPNNPMSSQKMLPNAGVSRAASHAAATHRQISSAAARAAW